MNFEKIPGRDGFRPLSYESEIYSPEIGNVFFFHIHRRDRETEEKGARPCFKPIGNFTIYILTIYLLYISSNRVSNIYIF